MKIREGLAVLLLLSAGGHASGGQSTSTQQTLNWAHNPNKPFSVWVICMDTSRSPQSEQFRRMQAVAEEIVERDVGFNDLVFLLQIRSGFDSTQPFSMPVGTTLASKMPIALKALADRKAEVISAIRGLQQTAVHTDLKGTLDVALDLLRDQPGAKRHVLTMVTDFLTDMGSADPAPPKSRCRATGAEALLLVAYPKPECLRAARLTASGLFETVSTKWSAYFAEGGARSVTVRLVDTVYSEAQNIQTRQQGQTAPAVRSK